MNVFVVMYLDAHKSQNSEILGVYKTKEDAIDLLVGYLTDNHNPGVCNINGCEWCSLYHEYKDSLESEGVANDEYEIHQVELGKKWYDQ